MAKYSINGRDLEVVGDLLVKVLEPVDCAIPVDGTVSFNGGKPISVIYPDPSVVEESVPIGNYADGNFTRMHTVQNSGGSRTLYLFYIDNGDTRTYYESPSPTGSPMIPINTVIEFDNYLVFELKTILVADEPTIVIGTIIIETEAEEA